MKCVNTNITNATLALWLLVASASMPFTWGVCLPRLFAINNYVINAREVGRNTIFLLQCLTASNGGIVKERIDLGKKRKLIHNDLPLHSWVWILYFHWKYFEMVNHAEIIFCNIYLFLTLFRSKIVHFLLPVYGMWILWCLTFRWTFKKNKQTKTISPS